MLYEQQCVTTTRETQHWFTLSRSVCVTPSHTLTHTHQLLISGLIRLDSSPQLFHRQAIVFGEELADNRLNTYLVVIQCTYI